MNEDWPRLERELRKLEERDSAVKAARERVEHVTSSHEMWRRQMIRDLWGANDPRKDPNA